jgi:LacI family transcriptional regulator
MPVRLKDIAAELNLSKMTISKVLRGQTDVSEDTKARVLQRARELNYRPNTTARSLRTGQSFMMGLVMPGMGDDSLGEIARGVTLAIRSAGYGLVVCPSQNDPELEQQQIELLLSQQVDVLMIVSPEESAPFLEQLLQGHTAAQAAGQVTPLICVLRRFPGATGNFVGIDEEQVGRIACEHLIACGNKRIAYLRGPHTAVGDLRYAGFREALSDAGVVFHPELVVDAMGAETSEYRRGFDGMLRLLEGRGRPDGVMAYSDMIAVGAMDASLSRGVRIPESIAFVGSGNDVRLCEMRVPLSSVAIPGHEVGQKAGRMALRLAANGGTGVRKVLVAPQLVERGSRKRPR